MKQMIAATILMTLVAIFSSCASPTVTLFPGTRDALKEFTLQGEGDEKILMIPVSGTITHESNEEFLRTTPSTVQEIVAHLNRAERDKNVKAIMLKIDSPGGSVTASDMLYHELLSFKQRTGKTIVAAMMNVAASGGYYIALPADAIIAHPTTVTGSVGVIFMRPTVTGLTEKIGVGMEISKSGINKDMGSPFRKPTDAEKRIFEQLTTQLGKRFLDLVARHRKVTPEKLEKIATARIFLADQALELGMIDSVGYLSDALAQTKKMAALKQNAKVVVYRRSEFRDDNIYNPATQTEPSLAGLAAINPWAKMGFAEAGFYYMWTPLLSAH